MAIVQSLRAGATPAFRNHVPLDGIIGIVTVYIPSSHRVSHYADFGSFWSASPLCLEVAYYGCNAERLRVVVGRSKN